MFKPPGGLNCRPSMAMVLLLLVTPLVCGEFVFGTCFVV